MKRQINEDLVTVWATMAKYLPAKIAVFVRGSSRLSKRNAHVLLGGSKDQCLR